jgi:hypothetical protein
MFDCICTYSVYHITNVLYVLGEMSNNKIWVLRWHKSYPRMLMHRPISHSNKPAIDMLCIQSYQKYTAMI